MKTRYCFVTCLTVIVGCFVLAAMPGSALAKLVYEKSTDYQCDLNYIRYSDQQGRIVEYNFSDYENGESAGDQIVYFNDEAVTYKPSHVGVFRYKLQADEVNAPASCLHYLDADHPDGPGTPIGRVGVDSRFGDFAWFPLVLGADLSYNVQIEVTFSNFHNVGEKQEGYHFELVAGGCKFTAYWFSGSHPKGGTYANALMFAGAMLGPEGQTIAVSNADGSDYHEVVTNVPDPADTTVVLRMIIGTSGDQPGSLLSASYKINDRDHTLAFAVDMTDLGQAIGYNPTYTDEFGVVHEYEEGDPPGSYFFPFINIFTATYPTDADGNNYQIYDEHVGGACFVSEIIGKEGLPKAKDHFPENPIHPGAF